MPPVTKETIRFYDCDTGFRKTFEAKISVDIDGLFYCYPPQELWDVLNDNTELVKDHGGTLCGNRKKHGVVCADTLSNLRTLLRRGWEILNAPEGTEELVIRYVMDSHVSFAEQPDGTIVPNASYPNAKWVRDKGRYGDHHATDRARDGYSMHVGAKACIKQTKRFGKKVETHYESYYGTDENGKPNSHLSYDHPAAQLNSWCAFDMENPKEMPYTDEAALFFHSLMLGMAELQRRMQAVVADEEKFIEYVNSGMRLLPFGQEK